MDFPRENSLPERRETVPSSRSLWIGKVLRASRASIVAISAATGAHGNAEELPQANIIPTAVRMERSFSIDPLAHPKSVTENPLSMLINQEECGRILEGFQEHLFCINFEKQDPSFHFDIHKYPPHEHPSILWALAALTSSNGEEFWYAIQECPTLYADLKTIEDARQLVERPHSGDTEKDLGMSTVDIGLTVRYVLQAAGHPDSVDEMVQLLEQSARDLKEERTRLKDSKNPDDMKRRREAGAQLVKIGAGKMGISDRAIRMQVYDGIRAQFYKDILQKASVLRQHAPRIDASLMVMALVIEGLRRDALRIGLEDPSQARADQLTVESNIPVIPTPTSTEILTAGGRLE